MNRISRTLGLGIALAVAATAVPSGAYAQSEAIAPQSEPPPSTAALALARLIGSSGISWLRTDDSVEEIAAGIARSLLSAHLAWRGVGCEPKNPECRAVAERMAREAAPGLLAVRKAAGTRFVAYMIDEQMKPDEIAVATTAVRTPGGQSIIRLFHAFADPAKLSPTAAKRLRQAMVTAGLVIDRDFRDRFFDATKHLPRAAARIPPPIAPPRPGNVQ